MFFLTVKKILAVIAIFTVFAGVSDVVLAKRAYEENNDTKVSTERKSFRERIDAIMAEIDNAEQPTQKEYDIYPGTPVITSIYDESILGRAMATEEQCVNFLLSKNPSPKLSVSPEELVSLYYEEASREGVRPDVAFAQALHETGFFAYGGTVIPEQNNYCGLGTTSSTVKGHFFPTARMGVRAHIQHIIAYATSRMPVEDLVDPRFQKARNAYGSLGITTWTGLNGRWAVPGIGYGDKIMNYFRQILNK